MAKGARTRISFRMMASSMLVTEASENMCLNIGVGLNTGEDEDDIVVTPKELDLIN